MLNNLLSKHKATKEQGFTLIELLVVIVIIGVLAAIALPIFMNQQRAAHDAATTSSFRQLRDAIEIARLKTGKTLLQVTGNACTGCSITSDPLAQPKTAAMWVNYTNTLKKISDASGMDVNGVVDGYGRPFHFDENEGEAGGCSKDLIRTLNDPYSASVTFYKTISLNLVSSACGA